jgi:hypothetical protein
MACPLSVALSEHINISVDLTNIISSYLIPETREKAFNTQYKSDYTVPDYLEYPLYRWEIKDCKIRLRNLDFRYFLNWLSRNEST